MSVLKAACLDAGFARPETHLSSGNVVFGSQLGREAVKAELEKRLLLRAGKNFDLVLRTAAEIQETLDADPFPAAPRDRVVAIFLEEPPPNDAFAHVTGLADEEMRLGPREIFVFYKIGIGRSKLKIAAAKNGTARNFNTIAQLATIASRE